MITLSVVICMCGLCHMHGSFTLGTCPPLSVPPASMYSNLTDFRENLIKTYTSLGVPRFSTRFLILSSFLQVSLDLFYVALVVSLLNNANRKTTDLY